MAITKAKKLLDTQKPNLKDLLDSLVELARDYGYLESKPNESLVENMAETNELIKSVTRKIIDLYS